MVTEHWRRFVDRSAEHLLMQVRERLPLLTPTAGDGNLVLPLCNTLATAPISDLVITVAAAASAQAEIDHHHLCFCYWNLPDMDLVRLTCCKQTVHRQCLLAFLGINSQCPYCRGSFIDIAAVLAFPTINRSEIISATLSPSQQTPTGKQDLQSLLLDETPLRLADTRWSESQEKKQDNQRNQAKRMIKAQGKDIADKGAAPGAVVTVKCDEHAVSHAIGIVGIIYQMSKYGGTRIARIAGILSAGSGKRQWWIPTDQYAIVYGATEEANITPQLMQIHEAILAGTYNINNSTRKCTIQDAHQQITQAIIPCKKSKCGCKGGACKAGVNLFPPAKEFDGKKFDAAKNRHILRVMFVDVPLIAELVKYFEEKYTKIEVQSVWMMEKLRENDSFQGWHRDFYLGR
jgi:hypothetical protein